MRFFNIRIISNKEYIELKYARVKYQKLIEVKSWFSGWKDLGIIWKYIDKDWNIGGIARARRDYAEARGTDEYGVKR